MKKSALILFLMFLAVYIAPLGMRPMVQPDETRYAQIAREMLQTGDFVTPHLNGIRYFEKPVFGYWLYAASMNIFGDNAFGLRLPCALAAGIAALSIFLLVHRFAGGYLPGLIAASVYLTMPFVFMMANLGILDSILSSLLTVALCLFYFALMEPCFNFQRVVFLIACGVFCGFAFLTKGFLAFAVPALTATAFLVWERRWTDFLKMPWIPAFVAAAVAMPWALAIHQAEPEFWHYFFWVEHVNRFFSKAAAQHSEPFFYFIPILFGGMAIWLLLIPSCVLGLKETGLKSPFLKYCLCWLCLPFLFFSLSSGKLAPYILPCFAPLAILMAAGLHKCYIKGWTKEFQFALWPLTIMLAIGLAGFTVNQATGFPATLYVEGESHKWIIAVVAGLIWLASLAIALGEKDFWRKLVLFCLGPASVLFAFNFIMPERIIERKAPSIFLERNKGLVPPDAALVSWRDPSQSVFWVFDRHDVFMYLSGGELDDGLKFPDSKHRFLKDSAALSGLIAERSGRGGVVLILPNKILWEEQGKLPKPDSVKAGDNKRDYAIVRFK